MRVIYKGTECYHRAASVLSCTKMFKESFTFQNALPQLENSSCILPTVCFNVSLYKAKINKVRFIYNSNLLCTGRQRSSVTKNRLQFISYLKEQMVFKNYLTVRLCQININKFVRILTCCSSTLLFIYLLSKHLTVWSHYLFNAIQYIYLLRGK